LRTHRTGTARFNWIVLLVSGLLMFGIGATGVAAGAADRTTVWFVMGLGLLIGAVVLRRMRLP
jgi:NADH:ubiquinone oxidoreductase subunit K